MFYLCLFHFLFNCVLTLLLNITIITFQERQGAVEDYPLREQMVDGLQLRFSLLGGMFDTIQRNATVTADWAILLVQLISHGVIDYNNNA